MSIRQIPVAGRAVVALALLALAACGDSTPTPSAPDAPAGTPREAAQVTRDSAALATFVSDDGGQPVPITPPANAASVGVANQTSTFLRLVATVAPPTVNGQTLEATDVTFSEGNGNVRYAYVAYSKRGEPTLGAVDVVRISSSTNPRLESRVTFTDTDVFAIAVGNGRLYLAGMTSAAGFAERAVLEVVTLTNQGLLPSPYVSTRVGLPSFAGTSLHLQGGKLWVTSGTGGPNVGALSVFNATTLALLSRTTLDDARSVGGDSTTGVVVVSQGTPGRVRVFSQATNQPVGTTVTTGGSTIAEARGDVKVSGNWAFVAASDGGTRVLRVDASGAALRGNGIALPIISGLAPELSTVNGLAVTPPVLGGSLLFTANGEAGIHAYLSLHGATSASGTPAILPLGRLAFPAAISANFVRVDPDGKSLVVASGLGGFRIVSID